MDTKKTPHAILAKLQFRKYNKKNYNCSHFVREAWFEMTGVDIEGLVNAWNSGSLPEAMQARSDLTKLKKPQSPCIVMFSRPGEPPHVGIWLMGDWVYHMTDAGVNYARLKNISQLYTSHKFYTCLP